MVIGVLILGAAAYLLGSLNAAAVVARSRGIDIYSMGSGNPGASNVYRTVGKGAAMVVYLADVLKGFLPALIGLLVFDQAAASLAGLCAVVGHCYPVFYRFRGGKGVATGGGVILAVAPLVLLALGIVYGLLVALTKISSIGSLAALLVAVPAAAVAGVRGWALVWLSAAIALIVWRHRSNIARLLGGSEHKVATQ